MFYWRYVNTKFHKGETNVSKPESIMIDDVKYIRADAAVPEVVGDYAIVRCDRSGVYAGTIIKENGREATVANARRLWYWSGAASLSQLAMEGTKKPSDCKFPCEVSEVRLKDVIEIIPCTEAAKKSIKAVKVWAQ